MRQIPDPGFAGDDGTADPRLTEVLSGYDADPDFDFRRVLAVFQHARVLVPVIARPGGKTSDMATVLTRGSDGRLGMFAFTSTAAMTAWNAAARPVPVTVRQAAEAALAEDAQALLVDLRGPVFFVVGEQDLRALAAGQQLLRTGDSYGWYKPVRAQR